MSLWLMIANELDKLEITENKYYEEVHARHNIDINIKTCPISLTDLSSQAWSFTYVRGKKLEL